ncbi:MAG: hypothetical protein JXB19_08235 [Bacteroidales bacterium]|nr:hypothetical protein [Bacteroidales bacterium]
MKIRLLGLCFMMTGLLAFCDPGFSQSRFEIAGGLGLPEALAVKIKYGRTLQVGVSQGIWFLNLLGSPAELINAPTFAEIYYHFSGKPKFNEPLPWYVYGGFGYRFGEDYVIFCPRIGRSFYDSEKFGVNIDAGLFFFLKRSSAEIQKQDFMIWLSGSISFFIRL